MSKSDKIMDSRTAALLRDSVLVKYIPIKGSNSRIIKLVKTAEDPLQPPKFRYRKIPRAGRDSPPPVVLHSPPRQLTAEEIKYWNVPPCVSLWKNQKGYTIPLDKRQPAAVSEPEISHRAAEVFYALYAAEDKNREEIALRSKMRREREMREKERRDVELRNLARRAREECGGGERKKRRDGGGEERKKKKKRSRREGGGLGESARGELLYDRSLVDAYGNGDGDGERDEVKTKRKMREREREGPIEFEKEADIFGLDEFLSKLNH